MSFSSATRNYCWTASSKGQHRPAPVSPSMRAPRVQPASSKGQWIRTDLDELYQASHTRAAAHEDDRACEVTVSSTVGRCSPMTTARVRRGTTCLIRTADSDRASLQLSESAIDTSGAHLVAQRRSHVGPTPLPIAHSDFDVIVDCSEFSSHAQLCPGTLARGWVDFILNSGSNYVTSRSVKPWCSTVVVG